MLWNLSGACTEPRLCICTSWLVIYVQSQKQGGINSRLLNTNGWNEIFWIWIWVIQIVDGNFSEILMPGSSVEKVTFRNVENEYFIHLLFEVLDETTELFSVFCLNLSNLSLIFIFISCFFKVDGCIYVEVPPER